MLTPRKMSPLRRSARASARRRRAKPPLDAAGLILELEMAELIRAAGPTLRRSGGERRGVRGWWRRLFG
jgi:hypothetical protein